MDATSIASLATAMTQTRQQQDISMAVLKKAMNADASAAVQLIEALPQPNLPAHLGQNVNTTA